MFFHENAQDARVNLGNAAYDADTLQTELPCPVVFEEIYGQIQLRTELLKNCYLSAIMYI